MMKKQIGGGINYKNPKGFTLIELLAVIVILAVIALILTPIVTGIIEQSKKKAEEASALYYIDAVEKYMILHEMNSEKYPYNLEVGKTYYIVEDSSFAYNNKFSLIGKIYAEEETTNIYLSDFIEVKGEAPIDGYVVIGEKNKVASASFGIKKYEVNCDNSSCEATGKFDSSIIRVNSITIDSIENTTIKPDETLQLSATVLPNNATNKTVTWISSDETVATVDKNGLVTGISEGTVVITAKTGKKNTSIEIHITKPPTCSLQSGTYLTVGAKYKCTVANNLEQVSFYILNVDYQTQKVRLLMEKNYVDANVASTLSWQSLQEKVSYIQNLWTNVKVDIPSLEELSIANNDPTCSITHITYKVVPTWMNNTKEDYWTSSSNSVIAGYLCGYYGYFDTAGIASYNFGLRPVIEISTSEF